MPHTDRTPPITRPGLLSRLRALPTGFLTVGALVLISGAFRVDALRDAATYERVSEAHLVKSPAYVALAPVSNVLDTLTLLGVGQHIAVVLTVIVCYGLWWALVGRRSLQSIAPRRRLLREVARIGVGLVILIGTYVVMIVAPRPMARLEKGTDIVAVDFHAHTKYSHDGRPDWTPEDVRTWHANAGFDVAYISDHRTFEGARDGWANNPVLAGDRTVLIPAIEVGWRGEHVNVLDADRLYHGLITENLRDIDEPALGLVSTLPGNEPVIIETIPGDLAKVVSASGPGSGGVRAIEIIDGSPRGLTQARVQHDAIVHLADSVNLALVAGSDHHGWGRTAAGWTLMYAPGWRAATAEQLSVQISRILRGGGVKATRVAERYVANTEGALLPFTVPLVTWGMLRSLDADERIVWFIWLTLIYALVRLREARRRTRPPSPHTP